MGEQTSYEVDVPLFSRPLLQAFTYILYQRHA